jgi:predicted small secreted protein
LSFQSFGLRGQPRLFISNSMKNALKIILAASLLLTMLVISGCNTVKGVGRDFEAMGESIQKAGD